MFAGQLPQTVVIFVDIILQLSFGGILGTTLKMVIKSSEAIVKITSKHN
jgi:hypothetical protein